MDPNGGINPSNPRLDSVTPPASQPQPTVPQPIAQSAPVVAPDLTDELPTGFNDQPLVSPQQVVPKQASGKFKKTLMAIIAVIVVIAMVGGAYFYGLTTGKTVGQNKAAAEYQKKLADMQKNQSSSLDDATTDTAQTSTEDAAKLDLTSLKDPKYIDETVEGVIGKQVAASDGLVLKVTNIERNFKSTDANYKLDSSKELVKVNFLIGNGAKDKPKDISNFNFRLENSSAAQLTPESIASYTDKFDTVKIEVGAQAKGSIVYAVNKDEKPLKFIRSQTYRISGQNKEVTTKIVIIITN